MERSRKILDRIASASHQVITAANEYADRKDSFNVERSHFQLEEDMQKISVACQCLTSNFGAVLRPDNPAFEKRLKDWLMSDGPRTCYETLEQIERLLREDTSSSVSSSFKAITLFAPMRDKLDVAINLFNSHKGRFHYLFTAATWNNDAFQSQGSNLHVSDRTSRVPMDTDIVSEAATRRGEYPNTGIRDANIDKGKMKADDARSLEEVLQWLDGMNCAEKQDVVSLLRQPDTCRWLFDTGHYKMWRDGERPFLWLRGKPGAGKSVLASSVIHSLEKSRRDGEVLAYFYCDFRNEHSTRAADVMRSILYQLLRQLGRSAINVGSCVDELIKAKQRGGATRNDAMQLARFASQVAGLSTYLRKPRVVVDALDECKDVHELLRALMVVKNQVCLFVTGRPLHVIMHNLFGLPFISMDDMTEELSADIELHVTRELDARRRLQGLDSGFKAQICSVLCQKSDGMFRWIQCSIDMLDRCATRKDVKDALNNLPQGLDETYGRILFAIDVNCLEGQLARRALDWLVAAVRPLRLEELMEALSINLRTRTLDSDMGPMHCGALLDVCGSLVTYFEKSDIVVLSHFSVKEYLIGQSSRSKLPQYHVDWEGAHLHVVRSCMCYISMCLSAPQRIGDPTDKSTPISPYNENHTHFTTWPLRDYVLDNSIDHFGLLGPQIESILPDIAVLERNMKTHSKMWNNMCLSANRVMHHTTPGWPTSEHDLTLYTLIAFSSSQFLDGFIRHPQFKFKKGTNPLLYAAYFNKDTHARTLLSRGARLNLKGWEVDRYGQALPIEVAIQNHHYAMLTLFLAEGSMVPLHIFDILCRREYPELPISILKMLFQTDEFAEAANVSLKELISRPSHFVDRLVARWHGVDERDLLAILQRITQVGCDLFGVHSHRDQLLRTVVQREYVGIARYILSFGYSLPSDLLITTRVADMQDGAKMIRFLAENGANTLAHNRDGDSVFHIAMRILGEREAVETAKLLVGYGCDHTHLNSHGTTPLYIAVENGYLCVIQYFLSLGDRLPSDILLAINSSAMRNGARMVTYLVENGVDVLVHTTSGDSMLHIAIAAFDEYNALNTAKLLVTHGCNPLEPNACGKTPLHVAVGQGHVSVAQYLLSLGASLFPDMFDTSNLLDMRNGPRMIRFLVEHGSNITNPRREESLFRFALDALGFSERDTLETAKFLLARDRGLLQPNGLGERMLRIAIERGRVSVVHYLLSLGVPLPSSALVTSPHDLRMMWDGAQMVKLLVEHGYDVRSCTDTGDNMIHIALDTFEDADVLEMAKFLVSHGCNPFQANHDGETPLCIAIRKGHVPLVGYLLSLGALLSPVVRFPDMLLGWKLRGSDKTAKMFTFLIEHGVKLCSGMFDGDDNPIHQSMFHIAVGALDDHDALRATKLLIARGHDLLEADGRGSTPLDIAIKREHVAVVRYILSLGVPLPTSLDPGAAPIAWKKTGIVRCLVENGSISLRTKNEDSLLHMTLEGADEEDALQLAKLLVRDVCGYGSLGASSKGKSPLEIAIERGHISVARYLLSVGAPLPPDALFTALYPRRLCGKLEMVNFLVNQDSSILETLSDGERRNTILHVAVDLRLIHDEELEIITSLVASGCDPAAPNAHGITPLHIAVWRENVKVVEHLLSLNTPPPPDILFVALETTSLPSPWMMKIVKALVDGGCNTQTRNESGHTPLQVASQKRAVEIIDYLLDAAGDAITVDDDPQPMETSIRAPRNTRGGMTYLRYCPHGLAGLGSNLFRPMMQPGIRDYMQPD